MKANIPWPCLSGSFKVLERLKLKQKFLYVVSFKKSLVVGRK
jgi:hypothetical protein